MLDLVDNLLVANITSGNNDDVFTVVVSSVVISQILNTKSTDVVAISLDWLAHHMLSVHVEVSILNSSLLILSVVLFMFLSSLYLELLKFSWIQ